MFIKEASDSFKMFRFSWGPTNKLIMYSREKTAPVNWSPVLPQIPVTDLPSCKHITFLH